MLLSEIWWSCIDILTNIPLFNFVFCRCFSSYLYSNLLSGGKLFVSTCASGSLVKWQNSVKIQIQRSYCFRFRFDRYCISGLFFLCCYFSRMAWYNNCNGHLRRQYHRIIVSFKVYIFLLCRALFRGSHRTLLSIKHEIMK